MMPVYVIGAFLSLGVSMLCAWLYEPACRTAQDAYLTGDSEVGAIAGLFAAMFQIGGWLGMGVFLALFTLAVLTQVGRI